MARKPKTSLIILTRNEIAGVRALLSKIPKKGIDETFAVDFRSTDGTTQYFRKHGIRVISQETPGRAEAFRIGAQQARGEYLVFFSPDGNEDPDDIPKLVEALDRGADMVIASRFMKGSRNEEDDQTFKFRAWANLGFTLLVRLLWGGTITDTINGYRAIRKDVFRKMHIDAQGFAVEYQMSIRARKMGLAVTEIPTYEGNRIGGQSTAYAIPTGLAFIRFLVGEILEGKKFLSSRV